jgi:hypothetical protein
MDANTVSRLAWSHWAFALFSRALLALLVYFGWSLRGPACDAARRT